MPSPVGHALAGLCGYLIAQRYVPARQQTTLLMSSVLIAVLPDIDVVPGLVLLGDPTAFHHQATHSVIAAVIAGVFIGSLARRRKASGLWWGMWGGSVYLSHIVLDLFVNDPKPPFGAQVFWPFSKTYFISSVTPLPRFDYFDPAIGMIQVILSMDNLEAILQEILLLAPFTWLAWHVGKKYADQ